MWPGTNSVKRVRAGHASVWGVERAICGRDRTTQRAGKAPRPNVAWGGRACARDSGHFGPHHVARRRNGLDTTRGDGHRPRTARRRAESQCVHGFSNFSAPYFTLHTESPLPLALHATQRAQSYHNIMFRGLPACVTVSLLCAVPACRESVGIAAPRGAIKEKPRARAVGELWPVRALLRRRSGRWRCRVE